jgi:TRAP-type transport system periplasmic protein
MDRRTVIKAAGATAVTAIGAPALIGFAQSTVTLKFHTFMAPTSNVWLTMHKAWMDKVEKDSGGRIKFEGYPAMQLGGTPPQLYDQARDGIADVTWTLPGNSAGRFPRVEVFELPFMMNNADATSRAYWEYVQTVAQDEFKEVQLLAVQVHGPGMFHMKDKLIKSAADLKGQKVRGPTRQITKMLTALGATPLTKFHSEFSPEAGALYTTTFVMGMNKAKYASLPPDLKAVIDKNSGIETSAFLGRTQQSNDPNGRKSASDRGNTIHTIGSAEADEFKKLCAPIYQEWIDDMNKKGFDGKKLFDTAKSLMEKHAKKV